MSDIGGTSPGETVAIFGAGPIGLMVAQWARALGASQVVLFDLVAEKIELARSLGFSHAYNAGQTAPLDRILELTNGQGAHVSIEAAGVPPTFLSALEATRRGGRMVMMGNPSADVTIPADLISQLMRREVDIFGTWNSEFSACGNDDDWHTTLEAMANKTIALSPLVTHRVPLQQSFDALRMMKESREFFAKGLIHP